MNISKNVMWIFENLNNWIFVKNRSYKAKIQKADSKRIYNVPKMPGVVYNVLEDSYEKVNDAGYVVTGLMGEMWPIGKDALKKYRIDNNDIPLSPIDVNTIELDIVYAAIRIPGSIQFTLEVDYGEKALLKGNRIGIEHDEGDYILVATRIENGIYVPDFTDSGRIVNGVIFSKLYKEL